MQYGTVDCREMEEGKKKAKKVGEGTCFINFLLPMIPFLLFTFRFSLFYFPVFFSSRVAYLIQFLVCCFRNTRKLGIVLDKIELQGETG
jgi:hypothetical protein